MTTPVSLFRPLLLLRRLYDPRRERLRFVDRRRRSKFEEYLDNNLSMNNVIYGIIAINVAVFLMWQYANGMATTKNDLSTRRWMIDNFTVNHDSLFNKGRWWTTLTCMFSHMHILHLGINMFVLYSFCPALIASIGVQPFLALYLTSGLAGSLASAAFQEMQFQEHLRKFSASRFRAMMGIEPPTHLQTFSLGASAAVTGSTVVYAALYPWSMIYIFGIVPIPAAAAVGGFVAYDLWRTWSGRSGQVDTAGHIGGAVMGFAWWVLRLRR
eukprot:jgi/Hompol1/6493/HPOL_000783-RA